MAHDMPVTLFKAEQAQNIDFSEYDCVGFASGIYAGRCHKSIYAFLKQHRHELPKHAFAVCTSAAGKGRYAKKFAGYLQYWENLNVKVLIPSDHLSCSVVPEKAAPTAMTLPTGSRLFRRLC